MAGEHCGGVGFGSAQLFFYPFLAMSGLSPPSSFVNQTAKVRTELTLIILSINEVDCGGETRVFATISRENILPDFFMRSLYGPCDNY